MLDTIICIGAGKDQLPIIEAIKKAGFRVLAIDQNKNAPGLNLCDFYIQESTHDFAKLKPHLEKLSVECNFLSILNRSSGYPVITTAEISNFLGFDNLPVTSARNIVFKDKCRKQSKRLGVKVPFFDIKNNINDIKDYKELNGKIIKSCITDIGKSGIFVINENQHINKILKEAFKLSLNNRILIEDYIEGIDLQLIGFVASGKLTVFSIIEELNVFNSKGKLNGRGMKTFDIENNQAIVSEIIKQCQMIINGFKITMSPFMASFRVKNLDAYLIEIHLDIGGDLLLEHLMPATLGVNYADLLVEFSMKKVKEISSSFLSPAAIVFENSQELISNREYQVIEADSFSNLEIKVSNLLGSMWQTQK